MKRFEFNLERVLMLRRYRERERELELAEVTGRCVALRREIDTAMGEKRTELDSRFTRGTDAASLQASLLYVSRLEQAIGRNEAALRMEEERLAAARASFLEAQRDRKVLDRLKERKAEIYAKERKLEEISEIDDMNTGRFGGKIGG